MYTNGTCALQMPSNYVVMDTEEMEYLEGGGTVKISISQRAVKQIISVGSSVAVSLVVAALTKCKTIATIAGGVAKIVVDYILNNVWSPKAVNVNVTKWYLPNFRFTYK